MDKAIQTESRRRFLKSASFFAIALPTGVFINCVRPAQTQPVADTTKGRLGGYCEGCEAIYEGMPQQLDWQTTLVPADPGEPFEMSGVIYQSDGRMPASGVILYFYHTNAKGIYSPAPDATGLARRHGHLRGWIKTNAKGEYKINTIRPASYPNRGIPAHVHMIVKEADKNEYYIDDVEFDDDPMLTQQERARRRKGGGPGIVRLTKSGGVWLAKRDIMLGLNVPNYR